MLHEVPEGVAVEALFNKVFIPGVEPFFRLASSISRESDPVIFLRRIILDRRLPFIHLVPRDK